MDLELTLEEIARLEAERKLRSLPSELLEVAWAREAQTEAVIDAVVTVAMDPRTVAHARHTGEWAARIASVLPFGPQPSAARRAAVLAELDPAALERIAELRDFASFVREYQTTAIEGSSQPRTMTLVMSVASEFEGRIAADGPCAPQSPAEAIRAMLGGAGDAARPVVEALAEAAGVRRTRFYGAVM